MTPARVKRPSLVPRRSSRPADDGEHLASGTRIKRAAVEPAQEREAIEASIDAALRDLDSLEVPKARAKAAGRRVPPFPGSGLTRAVPPLPSVRPSHGVRPKKRG